MVLVLAHFATFLPSGNKCGIKIIIFVLARLIHSTVVTNLTDLNKTNPLNKVIKINKNNMLKTKHLG